jgi:hypothetical protein
MAHHPPPFFAIVVERISCRVQLRVSRVTTTCVVRLPKLFNVSRTDLKYPYNLSSRGGGGLFEVSGYVYYDLCTITA